MLQNRHSHLVMEIMLTTNLKAGKNANFEITTCFQVAELQLGYVPNSMEKMHNFP